MLKLLTIVVAGVLTIVTLRRVLQQLQAQKARVMNRTPNPPRALGRLRLDPKTGVYYPES